LSVRSQCRGCPLCRLRSTLLWHGSTPRNLRRHRRSCCRSIFEELLYNRPCWGRSFFGWPSIGAIRACLGSCNLEMRGGACSGAGALDVAPLGRPTGEWHPPVLRCSLRWDHGQGLYEGRRLFHHRFSSRVRGVDHWRSRWMRHGWLGGYGFGISLASHGLMMGC
jgi:hypothetical protein